MPTRSAARTITRDPLCPGGAVHPGQMLLRGVPEAPRLEPGRGCPRAGNVSQPSQRAGPGQAGRECRHGTPPGPALQDDTTALDAPPGRLGLASSDSKGLGGLRRPGLAPARGWGTRSRRLSSDSGTQTREHAPSCSPSTSSSQTPHSRSANLETLKQKLTREPAVGIGGRTLTETAIVALGPGCSGGGAEVRRGHDAGLAVPVHALRPRPRCPRAGSRRRLVPTTQVILTAAARTPHRPVRAIVLR